MKLAINPFEGEIPQRYMWVKTGHKDSLDSRYELSGLIHSGQIIGKAVPIFLGVSMSHKKKDSFGNTGCNTRNRHFIMGNRIDTLRWTSRCQIIQHTQ